MYKRIEVEDRKRWKMGMGGRISQTVSVCYSVLLCVCMCVWDDSWVVVVV